MNETTNNTEDITQTYAYSSNPKSGNVFMCERECIQTVFYSTYRNTYIHKNVQSQFIEQFHSVFEWRLLIFIVPADAEVPLSFFYIGILYDMHVIQLTGQQYKFRAHSI